MARTIFEGIVRTLRDGVDADVHYGEKLGIFKSARTVEINGVEGGKLTGQVTVHRASDDNLNKSDAWLECTSDVIALFGEVKKAVLSKYDLVFESGDSLVLGAANPKGLVIAHLPFTIAPVARSFAS